MPTQTANLQATSRPTTARLLKRLSAARPRDDVFNDSGELTIARAIGYAALMSLPFWALLGFAIYLML